MALSLSHYIANTINGGESKLSPSHNIANAINGGESRSSPQIDSFKLLDDAAGHLPEAGWPPQAASAT